MARETNIVLPEIQAGLSDAEVFKRYTDAGITNALAKIKVNLEVDSPATLDASFSFHTRAHTIGFINRATRIARAIGLPERQVQLIRLKAAYHDVEQGCEKQEQKNDRHEVVAIKRLRPRTFQNEERSAEALVKYMQEVNAKRKEQGLSDIYTASEIEGANDIITTIPGWDPILRTVTQPYFATRGMHGKILALADLSGAGMDGDVSPYEAATLFTEDNLDYRYYRKALASAGRRAAGVRDTQKEQALYDRLMAQDTGWLDAQIIFIKGREAMLSQEVANFSDDPKIRNAVQTLFKSLHFAQSRKQLEDVKKKIVKQPFDSWTKTLDNVIASVPDSLRKLSK